MIYTIRDNRLNQIIARFEYRDDCDGCCDYLNRVVGVPLTKSRYSVEIDFLAGQAN